MSLIMIGLATAMATASNGAAEPPPIVRFLSRIHSHNDYEQRHPLKDALNQRISSVEADIWLRHGQLIVSHIGWFSYGTLEDLYLEPLQRLVEERGSVYGDGRPFELWLDIKDGRDELVSTLHEVLGRYPMLSRFSDQGMREGPVTVILTGDEGAKKRYVEQYASRSACRDDNDLAIADPGPSQDERWKWYALKWSEYLDWDGRGLIPFAEKKRLESWVRLAHAKGRLVRFWGVPALESAWKALLEAGSDLISVDDLPRSRKFLESRDRSESP